MFASFANATNISLSGNRESCPVPGCHQIMRVMEGTYDFLGESVRVKSAPAWSVAALESVLHTIAEQRHAVSAAVTPQQVEQAVTRALEKVADASGAGDGWVKQGLSALGFPSLRGLSKTKKRGAIALAAVVALLLNWGTIRENVALIAHDAAALFEWAKDTLTPDAPELPPLPQPQDGAGYESQHTVSPEGTAEEEGTDGDSHESPTSDFRSEDREPENTD